MKRRFRKADPFSIVIFGGTGDLTHRKLAPALYRLMLDGHLPEETIVCGVARRDWSDEYFRDQLREAVLAGPEGKDFNEDAWRRLTRNMVYVRGDADGEKPPHELLSNREFQVLQLLAQGRSVNAFTRHANPSSLKF